MLAVMPPGSPRPTRPSIGRIIVIAAAIAAAANLAFLVLSAVYFASKVSFTPQGEVPAFDARAVIMIRVQFAALSVFVAAAGIGVAIAARAVSHAIMLVMTLASLVAGLCAAVFGLPGVLAATELVLGTVLLAIVPLSWRGSRAAWSFLVAIAAAYGVVLFFGAPKVRGVLDIGLWTTLILPGLNIVALVGLIKSRGRYAS
jgi:hypothetical protein